jgi:hypothetical protein
MKIKLQRSYRSKNTGTPVFVYTVSGNASDLQSFESIQGEYYREDTKTGEPLWFTTRCVGDNGNLIITTNDKIVADMSEFDKAASVAAQYGGNLGEQLASIAASKLLGGSSTPAEAPVEATTDASSEGLGDM